MNKPELVISTFILLNGKKGEQKIIADTETNKKWNSREKRSQKGTESLQVTQPSTGKL